MARIVLAILFLHLWNQSPALAASTSSVLNTGGLFNTSIEEEPGISLSSYNESTTQPLATSAVDEQLDESVGCAYRPDGPLVQCSFLPMEFIKCDEPIDLDGNASFKGEKGYGCVKFGGQKYSDVETTSVFCTVLTGIECYGERRFLRSGFPCIKHSGHHFVTTLLYSVLLGFLGIDRFCLGHTGTAIGKLITVGGVGVWWIIDIILLVNGSLLPSDGSNWEPYY